jgi:hypothetical protein
MTRARTSALVGTTDRSGRGAEQPSLAIQPTFRERDSSRSLLVNSAARCRSSRSTCATQLWIASANDSNLAWQLLRRAADSNRLDHLPAELGGIRWSRCSHRGLRSPKPSGVHETGSSPTWLRPLGLRGRDRLGMLALGLLPVPICAKLCVYQDPFARQLGLAAGGSVRDDDKLPPPVIRSPLEWLGRNAPLCLANRVRRQCHRCGACPVPVARTGARMPLGRCSTVGERGTGSAVFQRPNGCQGSTPAQARKGSEDGMSDGVCRHRCEPGLA